MTNFIDYAPAGYEVQAFRYILKRDRNDVLERYILQATEQMADERESLNISDGDKSLEFTLDDISYAGLWMLSNKRGFVTFGDPYENLNSCTRMK